MITLATLSNYTEQQVFDYVANHLLSQGEKCEDFDDYMTPACVYKNEVNQRCAAGCLIGPGEYSRTFEGNSWEALVESKIVPTDHWSLITGLQKVHDTWAARHWYGGLQQLAKERNLSTINLDQYAKENNYITDKPHRY